MLEAFTAGLLLITVSELGDKTFFIAVILAMRHSRLWVFIGVIAALAAMTILSVAMGQVASLLPQIYVKWAEILLFLIFGFKLLYDASRMPRMCKTDPCEESDAVEAVEQSEQALSRQRTYLTVLTQAFVLTFLAEWGDRTQIATIALAAAKNPVGVALGATLGHAICAAIAVIGGRLICGHLSERTITALGGALFLVFALVGISKAL